jgi:hypothetical protein
LRGETFIAVSSDEYAGTIPYGNYITGYKDYQTKKLSVPCYALYYLLYPGVVIRRGGAK